MNASKRDQTGDYKHYTFDFSQFVSIPHHARQMGPVYFITPRKIFGFRIDIIPKQLNFLIDEHETIGKDGTQTSGPNAVISIINWSLESDAYTGQNKISLLLGTACGECRHSRCLIDSGFASIKKLYRGSDCDSIEQLQKVVEKSAGSNTVVRYPALQWRDWKTFLKTFIRLLKGI
ncbi:LOW QUALITY PROTEIN: hypothetical protein KUTeg_008366, partial [Tegillarca granosa]